MDVKGLATDTAARAKVGVALVAPFGVVLSATGATLEGRKETKANWAESTILLGAHGADISHESGRAALDTSVRAVARARTRRSLVVMLVMVVVVAFMLPASVAPPLHPAHRMLRFDLVTGEDQSDERADGRKHRQPTIDSARRGG